MAFDGIVTKCIAGELKNNLIGCKVNKIFEPTSHDIILNLYGNGNNFDLAICTNSNFSRIHLTQYSKPNPFSAPNFCMFLRKHLVGSRIIDIKTFDLERVLCFCFEGYNELNDKVYKNLYVEIMGQFSNVVLVNENGTILDCLNHVSTKTRELLPVRPYELPTSTKHSFINLTNFEEFYNLFTSNYSSSVDKTFSDLFIGISRRFVQGLCTGLNIPLDVVSKENLEKIYLKIKKVIDNIENLTIQCITILDRKRFLCRYF